MDIPDKAIQAGEWAVTNCVIAADEREYQGSQDITQEELRRVYLEAAAPFIAAQALRDAEDAAYNTDDGSFVDVYRAEIAEWLTARADDLEAGK